MCIWCILLDMYMVHFAYLQKIQIWLKSSHGPIEVYLCPEESESHQAAEGGGASNVHITGAASSSTASADPTLSGEDSRSSMLSGTVSDEDTASVDSFKSEYGF